MSTECSTFPADDVAADPNAYIIALDAFAPGDIVIVTTPDQTHYDIAVAAIQRRMHVLVAKPIVKTIEQHRSLIDLARKNGVLVAGEYHKRWDPLYADAYNRIRDGTLGQLIYYNAYMSQPKSQLTTFAGWVTDKRNSDISYYLNAHHVDFLCVALQGRAKPTTVTAMASHGFANQYLTAHNEAKAATTTTSTSNADGNSTTTTSYDIEDSISLMVQFTSALDDSNGVAVFTSSWTAPKSDVHTQQRFHFLGHTGEINIDQAHRGYTSSTDAAGYGSNNPLFFRYQPDVNGNFAGQLCYGYASFAHFIKAANDINQGQDAADMTKTMELAAVNTGATQWVTAILEAGRISLDNQNKRVAIEYVGDQIVGLKVVA